MRPDPGVPPALLSRASVGGVSRRRRWRRPARSSHSATPAVPSRMTSEIGHQRVLLVGGRADQQAGHPLVAERPDRLEGRQVAEVVAGEHHLPGPGLGHDRAQGGALVHPGGPDLPHVLARLHPQPVPLGQLADGRLQLGEGRGRVGQVRVWTPIARPLCSIRTSASPSEASSSGSSSATATISSGSAAARRGPRRRPTAPRRTDRAPSSTPARPPSPKPPRRTAVRDRPAGDHHHGTQPLAPAGPAPRRPRDRRTPAPGRRRSARACRRSPARSACRSGASMIAWQRLRRRTVVRGSRQSFHGPEPVRPRPERSGIGQVRLGSERRVRFEPTKTRDVGEGDLRGGGQPAAGRPGREPRRQRGLATLPRRAGHGVRAGDAHATAAPGSAGREPPTRSSSRSPTTGCS